MPFDLKNRLVIGISSTSLFDLSEDDHVFKNEGLKAYCDRQIELERDILKPGSAFYLIREILNLNKIISGKRKIYEGHDFVEVILMSKNSPDTSLRILNSIEHHGLNITRAALTGGKPLAPYLKAFHIDLFLSTDTKDVEAAYKANIASALVYETSESFSLEDVTQELRLAFDGDAVIFSEESEKIYKENGLEAFAKHERENADKAMAEGPFAKLLKAIAFVQKELGEENVIRTALVTARNSPAHKRVILTLREWKVRIDEAFFLGGADKSPVIEAFKPHFFFDDQDAHLESTSKHTPAGKVPAEHSIIK